MTPNEKATELINKFLGVDCVLFKHDGELYTFPQGTMTKNSAVICALIVVNEKLNSDAETTKEFWSEVKEILNQQTNIQRNRKE